MVITIIILLILAGASAATLSGDSGLLSKTREAKEEAAKLDIIDQIQTDMVSKQLNSKGDISNLELREILEKYVANPETDILEEDDGTIKEIITKEGNITIAMDEIWSGKTTTSIAKDGSWNGTVNSPKLEGTGLTAVYWDGTEWIELTSKSSQREWAKWYDYSKQNWANAKSKDGSMWVWIPRYEYKIDYETKSIDVKFISIGTETTDSTYILHPAFSDKVEDGGWKENLPGFWVAKYVAGYQNGTVGEAAETVQYSNLKYTTIQESSNFLEETLTAGETTISYPVFKANTYGYNLLSAGDAFLLCKEIDTASMYGLNNKVVDSHMQKNSEWGAVAYLAHSQYGVNGNSENMNEVEINSRNLWNSINVNGASSGTKAFIYAITSYGNSNTPNDVDASSTKNMTGVFDIRGGLYERTAALRKGASTIHITSMITDTSTEYLTLYESDNKKGDATNETAGWNSDKIEFITMKLPVPIRGGYITDTNSSGIFAYAGSSGIPYLNNGFRACLAF